MFPRIPICHPFFHPIIVKVRHGNRKSLIRRNPRPSRPWHSCQKSVMRQKDANQTRASSAYDTRTPHRVTRSPISFPPNHEPTVGFAHGTTRLRQDPEPRKFLADMRVHGVQDEGIPHSSHHTKTAKFYSLLQKYPLVLCIGGQGDMWPFSYMPCPGTPQNKHLQDVWLTSCIWGRGAWAPLTCHVQGSASSPPRPSEK